MNDSQIVLSAYKYSKNWLVPQMLFFKKNYIWWTASLFLFSLGRQGKVKKKGVKEAKQAEGTEFLSCNFSSWIWKVHLVAHLMPVFHFCTLLKTPENQMFYVVFKGYKMGTIARNGLNNQFSGKTIKVYYCKNKILLYISFI